MQPLIYYPSFKKKKKKTFYWQPGLLNSPEFIGNLSSGFSSIYWIVPTYLSSIRARTAICLLIVQYHRSPYPCLQNGENSIQITKLLLNWIFFPTYIFFFLIFFFFFSTNSASFMPKQQSVFLTCFMSFTYVTISITH